MENHRRYGCRLSSDVHERDNYIKDQQKRNYLLYKNNMNMFCIRYNVLWGVIKFK